MPTTKECPLCGGTMHAKDRERTVQIPGNPNATTHVVREWVCSDCDYFEEGDDET
ncbi:MAG TPA: YgiT-type zinc finger protein [Vicinamibacterales bacterium]|jgi:YgiT-type zinc finger domain-containing protein